MSKQSKIKYEGKTNYHMEGCLTIRQTMIGIARRIRGDKLTSRQGSPERMVELYNIYGPLRVMIYPDEGASMWPEGRILVGTRINAIRADETGITFDVAWEHDRPISTGWKRRLLGP